ncbi:aspartate aminotransferase family protein [Streptomyces sp. NPDC020681]|uniref:aspartate aminotransferase family protein n=1 Tax=Streptomyces sp. NPDC020681 TaxID=3365083 RepID=UPI0037A2DCEB
MAHASHVQDILDTYVARTPRSRALHEEAKKYLPGGDTRTINHHTPYPIFMEYGRGARLTDADGNEYIDFVNNMSAIVHGHAHPALVAAAQRQVLDGTALGAPVPVQIRHAEHLTSRIPALEQVRYCNSGTEATMMAIRTARAFTGRDTIVKITNGYHGMHNDVQVSMITALPGEWYPQDGLPDSFPSAHIPRGVPRSVQNDVLLLPFNDVAAAEELFERHGGRIAGIIVEPMMGAAGCIPASPEYLHALRRLTSEHGSLLIFDECATFRLGLLQLHYGIAPDLMSLSKVIGGGLPLGAFGGRADVMSLYDPTRPGSVFHAQAFAGNNLCLTVGLAALETFGPDEIERLNLMGEHLKKQLAEAASAAGVKVEMTGFGSIGHLHWGEGPIHNPHDAQTRAADTGALAELVHLSLLNRGIYTSRRGVFTLSLPMTDGDLQHFATALREVLNELKPYIRDTLPHLIREGVAASREKA